MPDRTNAMFEPGMRTRRTVLHFLLLVGIIWAVDALYPSPGNSGEGAEQPITSLADLNGKRLGIISGTIHDTAANKTYDYTQLVYFDDVVPMFRALLQGDIDAVIYDDPMARFLAARDARFRKLPGNLQDDDYAFALRYQDEELYAQVDKAMRDFIRDGVVMDLIRKWLEGPASQRTLDEPEKIEGPPLRFGICALAMPFAYRNESGKIIGMDIELAQRIAARLNRPLAITDMPFGRLVPALLEGEVDMIGAALPITKDRRRIIHFTYSYYRGGVSAMVRAGPAAKR